MSELLRLMHSALTPVQPPPTIHEPAVEGDDLSVASGLTGGSSSDVTPAPASPLASNLSIDSDALQGDDFAQAFGPANPIEEVQALEQMRRNIYDPGLEDTYAKIGCSNLTRHLWSLARKLEFESEGELKKWARAEIEIEIDWTGNHFTQNNLYSTKNCILCMKETVTLFKRFNCRRIHQQEIGEGNLLNSRSELHGGWCNCTTRFLRLCTAVGHRGAEEAP